MNITLKTQIVYPGTNGSLLLSVVRLYFVLFNGYKRQSCIISFNVNSEKFSKILFPPVPSGAISHCGCLVVLNGCIHLCVAYKLLMINLSEVDFWRMDSHVEEWVKVKHYSGVQPRLSSLSQIWITRNWYLLAVSENNDSFNKIDMDDFAISCLDANGWKSSLQRTIYVETLVSPN